MRALSLFKAVMDSLHVFIRDRRGVTSIEYAVIALIIVQAIVGGITRIGGEVAAPLNQIASEL
jgi:pilus assembly protein Flp/PilA